jgi:phage terminase large subunit-like protein
VTKAQAIETAAAPKPRDRRSNAWAKQFPELTLEGGADIGELYYKAECRPLKELKPLHRKTHKIHRLDFRTWIEWRDRARKDLYWLGHDLIATPESGSGFVEHVHREMCSMFVPKNFDGVYHKDYTLDEVRHAIDRQEREKEMLLLCPTGAYKSTANKIDSVQWMLNVPDVRIFIMTGSGALSRKFLKEVKGFFNKPEGARYTMFQSLFPEYVIDSAEGETFSPLTTPARVHSQPGTPTLWVNSIDGAIAGWHCDVWKGDDIVNEENSNTEDTRGKLKDRYDNVSQNRPDEWAFRDHLGTRYFGEDWYGTRIDDFRLYPDTNGMKYLCRAAWTVKAEFADVPLKQLQEHMVDLYFPEKLNFKSLIGKCRRNEKTFRCQQLNEPAAEDLTVHFDEGMILAHTVALARVPPASVRKIAIAWDTAHSESTGSDYSAGAAGWSDEAARSLYVLEVVREKMRDSEVAKQVVALHRKWKPMFTEIEKFAGWELLAAEIQRVAMMYGEPIVVVWVNVDMTRNAKRNRIKSLETLINDDRLWFVDGDWMDVTTRQFTRFNGVSRSRKDDIPDAISRLTKLIPALRPVPGTEVKRESDADRKAREAKELRDKFRQQHSDSEYRTLFQSPPAPPAPPAEPARRAPQGPERIFGGSGIHL